MQSHKQILSPIYQNGQTSRSSDVIKVLGFMHQSDGPKSLCDWKEVGNPLILHNKKLSPFSINFNRQISSTGHSSAGHILSQVTFTSRSSFCWLEKYRKYKSVVSTKNKIQKKCFLPNKGNVWHRRRCILLKKLTSSDHNWFRK